LISAPKIDTDLLWGLSALFVLLALIYFVSVFYFRNKISRKGRMVKEKKKELSPMISEFLFYDQSANKSEKMNYIDLKIQIRELIKNEFDRKVLTEVLMDLRKDVSGNTRDELFHIYQDLELHKDAYEKLKSWRWEVVSKGIFELTQMNVVDSYGLITKFINDKRSTIRKQAELAAVTLKEEGISYYLDHTKFKISEWQQLKLLDVVRNKEDFIPPSFRLWLTSKNNYVVLFALRLIKHYNQNDASSSLIELVKHKNSHIKKEAIHCIREFNVTDALPTMKAVFRRCSTDVKMSILDTIAQIGSESDIDFLTSVQQKESAFTIKSKALSALNTITPESILPSKDLEQTQEWELAEDQPEETAQEKLVTEESVPGANSKKEANTVENLEVIAEVVDNALVDEDIISPESNLPEIDITSLPIVMDEEKMEPPSPIQSQIEPHENVTSVNDLDVIYEEVQIEIIPPTVNIDFLPLIVEQEENIVPELRGYKIVYEEVLDVPFLNIEIEAIDQKDEKFQAVHDEGLRPTCIDDIVPSSLVEIEVDYEEIRTEQIGEEQVIEIDWSNAFSNKAPLEISSLIEMAAEVENKAIETDKTDSNIPSAAFYDNGILETMVLLENISELGDHREIPFLKHLYETESSIDVRERISELIKRFKEEYQGIEYFKITEFEAVDSVFNELMQRGDLESKLILLQEIIAVGDEKEIPLLRLMIQSNDAVIREKATSALKKLMERLASEHSQVIDNEAVEGGLEQSDIFEVDFELQKSKPLDKTKISPDNSDTNGNTLFDHLCSMSSKLYDKFNG
jgi:HEAT repeat protein